MASNAERLRQIVLGRLESLERAGVQQLPKAARQTQKPATAALAVQINEAIAPLEPKPSASSELTSRDATNPAGWRRGSAMSAGQATVEISDAPSLAVLQQEVAPCTRCSELAAKRTQTVFGVGNPHARLCFMGEAPGADEDRVGEPFVGRAGQLLTKIIEACRLTRDDVYILNMIKCRPPANRNPLPDELAHCRGYLERQLELIQPEFICCLGAVASQNLLNSTIPIGRLRGKLHTYRGATVVCTFHPAYLLRNPAAKKDAWDDMKFLMRQMGVEL